MADRPTLTLSPASALRTRERCPVCGAGRVVVGRHEDREVVACSRALDTVTGRPGPRDMDHYLASELAQPVTLAAMASVPPWLRPLTSGRPAYAYAVGDGAPLLWAALKERKKGPPGEALTAYRSAMETRWTLALERGCFAPGAWRWSSHIGALGTVPSGATLVCTCGPQAECHLDWLGPYLARAGWAVTGRDGQPVRNADEFGCTDA